MLGISYFKGRPGQYVMKYRQGALLKEGKGLSFFYRNRTASVVAVPLESREQSFVFSELSADYQEITVQGQVTYQISQPRKTAELLDFTADGRGYLSEDWLKLPERLIHIIQDRIRNEISALNLEEAVKTGRTMGQKLWEGLAGDGEIERLGLNILGLRLTSLRPNPETARALEAGIREMILQEADEAIYKRRNAAVEQERIIRENELNTQIAVEEKEREIQSRKIRTSEERQAAEARMGRSRKDAEIELEKLNQQVVGMKAQNARKEGDADAYRIAALMKAYNQIDPAVLETVKFSGMNPGQILADGFRELAKNKGTIGQLNVTPEILQALGNLQRSAPGEE